MKTFHEYFKDRIDMTDGTVVIDETTYNAIVQEARGFAVFKEKLAKAMTPQYNDDIISAILREDAKQPCCCITPIVRQELALLAGFDNSWVIDLCKPCQARHILNEQAKQTVNAIELISGPASLSQSDKVAFSPFCCCHTPWVDLNVGPHCIACGKPVEERKPWIVTTIVEHPGFPAPNEAITKAINTPVKPVAGEPLPFGVPIVEYCGGVSMEKGRIPLARIIEEKQEWHGEATAKKHTRLSPEQVAKLEAQSNIKCVCDENFIKNKFELFELCISCKARAILAGNRYMILFDMKRDGIENKTKETI